MKEENVAARLTVEIKHIWITRNGKAVTSPPGLWSDIEKALHDNESLSLNVATGFVAEGWPILAGDPQLEDDEEGTPWEAIDPDLSDALNAILEVYDEEHYRFTDSFDSTEGNYFVLQLGDNTTH